VGGVGGGAAAAAPPAPARGAGPATFSLLAAGDILPHDPVIRSATGPGGKVDFSPLLAGLDPWVAGADLALCHLEVPIAPRGTEPSGYPVFGAPAALVRDLAEQGWDGCSTASNHSLDRGVEGVRTTLRRLDAAGMGHTGTARSAAEQDAPQLYRIRRDGRMMTVAHLAATYGTNGIPIPADAPWTVDLIDADDLVSRAKAARQAGVDAVVVSLHAGTEYTEELTDEQRDVVDRLARSRQVDLVIGHHAHIPQRIDRVGRGPDGDGMWVAYGLGNLLSNQSTDCCDARTSNGVLLSATFRQEHAGGPVRVADVSWTGSTVDIAAGPRGPALPDLGTGSCTL
jgi:poly-gamma-glutamate capsule biosynthesis protein CapA/YwtB (metallophosphatase superfamily)